METMEIRGSIKIPALSTRMLKFLVTMLVKQKEAVKMVSNGAFMSEIYPKCYVQHGVINKNY